MKKLGVVVYEPYLYEEAENLPEEQKRFTALGLTHDHFYKIRMADVVFVYNKGGYAGNSTTLEIGYAVACGKPLYALEDDSKEIYRHVLFCEVIPSPRELIKRLK